MTHSCWIDPNGIIHTVDSHKHAQYACKVLNLPITIGINEAILTLASHGWLHIGIAPFISLTKYKDLPELQYKALHKLASENQDSIVGDNILAYIWE